MRLGIFFAVILMFAVSCGKDEIKQKDSGLKEKEPATKEKDSALKQRDTASVRTLQSAPVQDTIKTITKSKDELWKEFLTAFTNAVAQRNKKEVVRLSLQGNEFFDGGGGATAEEWVNSADNETWEYWQKALKKGVKPFEKNDKITKDNFMIFVFRNNNWYWMGVAGD